MVDLDALQTIWSEALKEFRQESLRETLERQFPHDRNVRERISYDLPPTFQLGYVGANYASAQRRFVLIGQNPGEGTKPEHRMRDQTYAERLNEFAIGSISLAELTNFIGNEIKRWDIFRDKGIIYSLGESRICLLHQDVQFKTDEIGYLNIFPFKTVINKKAFKASALFKHALDNFVTPSLTMLSPDVIIRLSSSHDIPASLISHFSGLPIFYVMHPSDYNLSAYRPKLIESWNRLAQVIHTLD